MLDREKFKYIGLRVLRPDFAARRLMSLPVYADHLYASIDLSLDEVEGLRTIAQSATKTFENRRLLFVIGAMPRSGTNFLFELLLRHKRFARPGIPFDEFGVLAAPEVFDEPRSVIGWSHPPSGAAFARLEWMAYALSGFRNRLLSLAEDDTITVIKEPHAYHIELLPVMFPLDRCIVVLRNARYIVDSFYRTFARRPFGKTFQDVCLETAIALNKMLDFLEQTPPEFAYTLRYEDAAVRRREVMSDILKWLGEEVRPEEMSGLTQIPILGSSTHSQDANGTVTWQPKTPGPDFDPVARQINWTRAQEEVFEKICAPVNQRAGYEAKA